MQRKPTVLVLCTGNSARSQMAEGLLKARAGDKFSVLSAGTDPKPVHPLAIRALSELGIDISQNRSKHLREFLGHVPVHHLIIVCAAADSSCPTVWPGVLSRTAHSFDDPAAAEGGEDERMEAFRRVRDEIAAWLDQWSARMTSDSRVEPR